jgi:hypothetical protein
VIVNRVRKSVQSHHFLGIETHSRVLRLECAVNRLTSRSSEAVNHSNETGVCAADLTLKLVSSTLQTAIYTRDSIRLLDQTYFRRRQPPGTVTLHRAERCSDGRMVVVKIYEGSESFAQDEEVRVNLAMFSRTHLPSQFIHDFTIRTRFW